MEFIIDTVDLNEIKEAVEYMPIVGVTSNPSIVKKTNRQIQRISLNICEQLEKLLGRIEVCIFKSSLKIVTVW